MKADDMVKEHAGEFWSGCCFIARDKVRHFCEPVDKYEDRVVPIGFGKIDDEITRYAFPGTRRSWERRKFTVLWMARRLTTGT